MMGLREPGHEQALRHALGIAAALAVTLPAAACTASAHHGSAGPAEHRHLGTSAAATQPFPVQEDNRPGTSAWRITDLGAP